MPRRVAYGIVFFGLALLVVSVNRYMAATEHLDSIGCGLSLPPRCSGDVDAAARAVERWKAALWLVGLVPLIGGIAVLALRRQTGSESR